MGYGNKHGRDTKKNRGIGTGSDPARTSSSTTYTKGFKDRGKTDKKTGVVKGRGKGRGSSRGMRSGPSMGY